VKAKAFIGKRAGTWYYQVFDSTGKHVLSDNTNDWRKMFDAAFFDASAVRRLEGAGHKIKHSYTQLVDKAARA
jgi:hypothetical protein